MPAPVRPTRQPSRARPFKSKGNGIAVLGVCLLVGMIAIAAALYFSHKENVTAATQQKEQQASDVATAKQQRDEHVRLVRAAVADMDALYAPLRSEASKICNHWQEWLSRGGDVDRAVERALEASEAENIPNIVKDLNRRVNATVQLAMKAEGKDKELHDKLVTLSGQFQSLVNAVLSPSGSLISYSDLLGRIDGDFSRTSAEIKTLLSAAQN